MNQNPISSSPQLNIDRLHLLTQIPADIRCVLNEHLQDIAVAIYCMRLKELHLDRKSLERVCIDLIFDLGPIGHIDLVERVMNKLAEWYPFLKDLPEAATQ